MLYIYLDAHKIKVLLLKKSLLGQYETFFVGKDIAAELIANGRLSNPDVAASGLKELLNVVIPTPIKEKEVILITPQESFIFFRTDLPVDVSTGIRETFLREKARSILNVDLNEYQYDHVISESASHKQMLVFGISKEILQSYLAPLNLLELKLVSLIPEPFAYYKLFEKTLRQNKKETIWYVSYEQDKLSGYVFDSFGLLEKEKWLHVAPKKEMVETLLQKQADIYTNKGLKLNRLILSGKEAGMVRQDTFTKNVGVWTNPLKRIASHFYADYLQILGDQPEKPLPILEYDTLIGAFIFFQENKTFSLLKHEEGVKRSLPKLKTTLPSFPIPMKAIGLFLISFGITVLAFYGATKYNVFQNGIKMPALPFLAQATPTATPSPTLAIPTPTPTPALDRSKVKIKILNGSGIRGKATIVKDFLKSKGYEDILTGNAAAFDYKTTVIQIKKGSSELKSAISEDVATQVSKPTFEDLAEKEPSDIILIIGTDFK